jgi:hypothetical protein
MKYSDPYVNEVVNVSEWVLTVYSILHGRVSYLLDYLSRKRKEPYKNENSFGK